MIKELATPAKPSKDVGFFCPTFFNERSECPKKVVKLNFNFTCQQISKMSNEQRIYSIVCLANGHGIGYLKVSATSLHQVHDFLYKKSLEILNTHGLINGEPGLSFTTTESQIIGILPAKSRPLNIFMACIFRVYLVSQIFSITPTPEYNHETIINNLKYHVNLELMWDIITKVAVEELPDVEL